MSLHNGIDTVAIATVGIYTKTYGSSSPGRIANLFASFGLLEDAPEYTVTALLRGLTHLGMDMIMGLMRL